MKTQQQLLVRLSYLVFLIGVVGVQESYAFPELRNNYHVAALNLRGGQSSSANDETDLWPQSTLDTAESADAAPTLAKDPPKKGDTAASVSLDHSTGRIVAFGTSISDLKSTVADRSAQLTASLKKQLEIIKSKKPNLYIDVHHWQEQSTKAMQVMGPASTFLASCFYLEGGLTIGGAYALALIGSCSGFHLFLYFITVGYAFGVMIPLLAALYIYSKYPIENLTFLHSGLTLLWAVRAASFYLYREYVNWPQLHEKVVEVNKMAKLSSKIFCWLVYSFFYTTMVSPCLYRLKSATTTSTTTTTTTTTNTSWGVVGKLGLGLQALGLLLETVADYQKSAFKSRPGCRNQWCHVGLFQFSTFPNYLGEATFWYGTFLGGLACYTKVEEWIMALIGTMFLTVIIKGACASLGAKQLRKYGGDPEFVEFQRTHTILGPNLFVKKKAKSTQALNEMSTTEPPQLVL